MKYGSWLSPKVEKGLPSVIHGKGIFAKEDIAAGEIIALKGGHIIDRETLDEIIEDIHHSQLQISDDLWLAPLTPEEVESSMVYVNHSCEPNMVIQGQIANVALRNIKAGEEITADYGISFNDALFAMDCSCGTLLCRRRITGLDWKLPELQSRYGSNFPWHILSKIHHQKRTA